MYDFCTPQLQEKMVPIREVLKKQTAFKEEEEKRKKLAAKNGGDATSAAPEAPPKLSSLEGKVDAAFLKGVLHATER